MKKFIISLVLLAGISLVYGKLIWEITKLEQSNNNLNIEISQFEKTRLKIIEQYNKSIDLKKIENEMKEKNMTVAEKIYFFKIENN